MGNFNSCYYGGNWRKDTDKAKIIDSQGTLHVVKVPITAAELMLENPGYLVSLVDEIRRTRRIMAMKAEERLQGRRVYLLVPVGNVNCKVTELQMSLVESICRKKRRSRGGLKVLPLAVSDAGVGADRVVEDVGLGRTCGRKESGGAGHPLRHNRPWTPVLEPILEGC
ncbi:hypothetical protein Ancab_020330 [Ancistrocladus abbreviatus]